MKPTLKSWKMFPVSSPALNTIGRALCWISHFGPDGHEMRVINSLIRIIVCVSYFYGQGRTFSAMGFYWVKVGSTRKNVEIVGSSTVGQLMVQMSYYLWERSLLLMNKSNINATKYQVFLICSHEEFDSKTTKISFELQYYFTLSAKFIPKDIFVNE